VTLFVTCGLGERVSTPAVRSQTSLRSSAAAMQALNWSGYWNESGSEHGFRICPKPEIVQSPTTLLFCRTSQQDDNNTNPCSAVLKFENDTDVSAK